jgi:iron-sulfur cluster assembly protein
MTDATALDAKSLVRITEKAKAEIRTIFEREEKEGDVGLRLGVIGGGCSGLSYQMEFSQHRPDDTVIECGEFNVILDPKSTIYLKGITLDFQDGLQGKGFVFGNPNATNTCGCGESFSV